MNPLKISVGAINENKHFVSNWLKNTRRFKVIHIFIGKCSTLVVFFKYVCGICADMSTYSIKCKYNLVCFLSPVVLLSILSDSSIFCFWCMHLIEALRQKNVIFKIDSAKLFLKYSIYMKLCTKNPIILHLSTLHKAFLPYPPFCSAIYCKESRRKLINNFLKCQDGNPLIYSEYYTGVY